MSRSKTPKPGWEHVFLWEASTGMRDRGTLGGAYSYPTGINEQGQIIGISDMWPPCYTVGDSDNPRCVHAFLWQAGTGRQDLGTLASPVTPPASTLRGSRTSRYRRVLTASHRPMSIDVVR